MGASGYGPWDNDVGDSFRFSILEQLHDTFHRALNPAEKDNPRGNLDKARSAAAILGLIMRAEPELSGTRQGSYLIGAAECALKAALELHGYVENYQDPERAREAIQGEIIALRALKGDLH